jgi:hypothetical protein
MAKRRATLRNGLYDASVEHAVTVMRRAEATREKVVLNLEQLSQQLERKLKLGGLTEAQSARTRKLLSDTTTTIFSAYTTNQQLLQKDLLAVAQLEGKAYPDVLNKAFRRKLARATLSDSGLQALASRTMVLGAPTKDWWQQQGNNLAHSFATQIRIGIAAGENLNQLIARVRGQETGRVRTYTDDEGRRVRVPETRGGIMEMTRAHATSLVRTAYMSIVNSIVFSVLYGNRSLFEAVQAVAVLDNATTILCRARDGGKWDFNGMPTDDSPVRVKFPGSPPWHYNCRTILVPVPKRSADDGEGEDDERPRTYETWLREQDEDKQRELLGDERWKLWQSGKLSLSQLIDPSGRAIPLPTLKRQASRG